MTTSVSADFSETNECNFHGVPYLLTVSTVNDDTLCIEVEQKSDASRWRGDFTSRYIEDITSKTGNFKKFPVFVKMLLSAVKQASDSVFVDLLTYQDLEVLKQRKAGASAQHAAANRPMVPNTKRYLILTYAAEFDRVHYPLPLLYEEHPDPQRLKDIIAQLRSEVDALSMDQMGSQKRTSGMSGEQAVELRRMREENQALRQQLKQLDRAVKADLPDNDRATAEFRELSRELKAVRKERDLLAARVEGLEAELERERGLQRRELRRKAKEVQEAGEELAHAREQIRELKMKVRNLTEELESGQRSRTSADRIRATYSRPDYGRTHSNSGRSGSRGAIPPPSSSRPSSGRGQATTSRGHDTSSRERDYSPSSSRPNSAPAPRSGPRFDPTEYIRQQREKQERRNSMGGSSRNPTPPRSQASSARASPINSRPASAERPRGYSPVSGRPLSSDRSRPLAGGWGQGADRPQSRSRGASPSTSTTGRKPAWGQGDGWSKFPPISTNSRGPGSARGSGSRPQSAERAQSPGRALQEVKKKLSEFVTKRSSTSQEISNVTAAAKTALAPGAIVSTAPAASASGVARSSSKSALFEDASSEIADIDTRLHALQNFLRMAKGSTSSVASGSVV